MAQIPWLRERSGPAVALFSLLVVVLLGNAHGGYYPTAWGWCVLGFAWIAGIAFMARAGRGLDRLEVAFLGALTLFVAWNAVSIAWTSNVDASVLEVQRGLIYLFGVLAVLLILRRGTVAHLLGGLAAGATWLSVQALGDRLFPDESGDAVVVFHDRLQGALGYATGFALLGVMAALLALVFAVHARSLAARAAAAAALPVLLTTAYFTFSRGAVLAIGAGLLAAVAYDRRRLTLLTAGALVALPSAAAVWIASRAPALTSSRAQAELIADEGRELALVLLALTVASSVVAVAVGLAGSRVRFGRGTRRAYAAALAAVAVVVAVGGVMSQGGPGPLVEKAYYGVNREKLPEDQTEANDLNTRLGSIGTTARVNYWRVAWDQYREHPLIGSGAGTYEGFWLRHRPINEPVIDAHNLYLETLAQLGWPGLLLLVAMLALPLAAAARSRGEPLAAGALAAYVAYVVHAAIDWDWEIPTLTLFALFCAVALFAAREDRAPADRAVNPARARTVAVAVAVGLVAFSLVGLVGNRALDDANAALLRGDHAAVAAAARTAERWAPWSAQAKRLRGLAEFRLGRAEAGRSKLREAARRTPDDWRIWYDLGIASTGSQRARAFVRAATLNPMGNDIEALRDQGVRLPSPRPAR
ncbi:MAG: O-antigen ligase family protein [Solirubrobacteraceae bacterium]|nr:O-antigen ligase family protein [Solirubrobacteraceae bacterium]